MPLPEAASPRPDSTTKIVLWDKIVRLAADGGKVTDVAFVGLGRNVINPVEMVWMTAASHAGLVAVAARPIPGTAEAGEELGRRAENLLPQGQALSISLGGTAAVDAAGRVFVLRGGWTDSLQVPAGMAPVRDLALGATGLLYVLAGSQVLVYGQPPRLPLWSFALRADLAPAVGLAVSVRGEVYVAGQGKTALAVYDLDAAGRFRRQRSATARSLGVTKVAGVALTPPMLLPIPGREGWEGEDRFVILSDSSQSALVTVDARTLVAVGRTGLQADLPGVVPGRVDASNRGQIACVDARGGGAWALPTRVLAGMVRSVPGLRWRIIPGDSTSTLSGSTGP